MRYTATRLRYRNLLVPHNSPADPRGAHAPGGNRGKVSFDIPVKTHKIQQISDSEMLPNRVLS